MGCAPCTLGFCSYFVGISAPLAADCVVPTVYSGKNSATRVCASRGEGVRLRSSVLAKERPFGDCC